MKAYYNEFDPGAAAWLRQLIADGLITPGDVDDRSITDVQPADLVGYDRVHFFAGIGGWDYALQLAGWPHGEPVWTGSCPCQPFSAAGRGRGARDARHLWPEFHRLIAECRPAVVFGEQVASALGRTWLAAVRADLEELGYGVGAADLCAAGVGAPHIRQRIYWVAESEHTGSSRAGVGAQSQSAQFQSCDGSGEEGAAAGGMADRDGARRGARRAGPPRDGGDQAWVEPSGFCAVGGVDLASGQRSAAGVAGPDARQEGDAGEPDDAGHQEPGYWDAVEWLPCRDGKYRPTQPGLRPLAHGAPARVGRLRGYGNAIVPQVGAAFIEAYRETQRRPY